MGEWGIYVFSGTGNTQKCAIALKESLLSFGIFCDFHEISTETKYAGERDMILCYPVHGFNAPNLMLDFCRKLPSGDGRVWFLKTSGEPLALNDNSSKELMKILKRKGYLIKGEFHYVMPYNIVFRHSDELASLMWKTALERIPEAAGQIAEAAGKQIVEDIETAVLPSLSSRVISGLCRVEHWFYPKNGRFYHVEMNRCIRCMNCVNECPAGNISFSEEKFHFGNKCTGCMRCSFQCPEGAIHIGLLDFMRVNGKYDFNRDPEKALLGRYCKKAYQRYFQREIRK